MLGRDNGVLVRMYKVQHGCVSRDMRYCNSTRTINIIIPVLLKYNKQNTFAHSKYVT